MIDYFELLVFEVPFWKKLQVMIELWLPLVKL